MHGFFGWIQDAADWLLTFAKAHPESAFLIAFVVSFAESFAGLSFLVPGTTILIGLGATAISQFPEVIVQNEKNAGRYRMLLSQDRLPGALGITRSPADQATGEIIERLLCQGEAAIGPERQVRFADALAPFAERGLIVLEGDRLVLLPGSLPYARTVAALFDPYRQDSLRRFSSAV